jgi:exodeoxyribonuclease V alpha subunit
MVLRHLIGRKGASREVDRGVPAGGHSRIITTAHRINAGQMPRRSPGGRVCFYLVDRENSEQIATTLVEIVKARIPARFGRSIRDVQVLCPMNRGSLGIRELNQRLQNERTRRGRTSR